MAYGEYTIVPGYTSIPGYNFIPVDYGSITVPNNDGTYYDDHPEPPQVGMVDEANDDH